jgi:hypothetical protein
VLVVVTVMMMIAAAVLNDEPLSQKYRILVRIVVHTVPNRRLQCIRRDLLLHNSN